MKVVLCILSGCSIDHVYNNVNVVRSIIGIVGSKKLNKYHPIFYVEKENERI